MKEIASIVIEEIEQIFEKIVEELALREAALVAVVEKFINEHIEPNVKELVGEEMELEVIKLSEGKCKCSHQIKVLNEELEKYHTAIENLSAKLKLQLPPCSEESLKNDDSVVFYTGLAT